MNTVQRIANDAGQKNGNYRYYQEVRADAFLVAVFSPLVFLHDAGDILLDADRMREFFDLPTLERFVWDEEDIWKGGVRREQGYFTKKYGKEVWDAVIQPLQAFVMTIPGYEKARMGRQEQKTLEKHSFVSMELVRQLGDLADQISLGDLDFVAGLRTTLEAGARANTAAAPIP